VIESNWAEVTTPIKAFIIFKTQEGYERTCRHLSSRTPFGFQNKKRVEYKFLDQAVRVREAPEPSNIIWENLELGKR